MVTSLGFSTLLSVGLPLVALAGAVVLYPRFDIDHLMPTFDSDQLAAVTIGIAATYLGGLLALGIAWFGTGIRTPLLAIGFGFLGTALGGRYPATATTRTLIEGTIGGLLAYAASNVLIVTTTTATTIADAMVVTVFVLLATFPAVLIVPLGHADARSHKLGTPIRVAIVAAPLVLSAVTIATMSSSPSPRLSAALGGYLLGVAFLGVLLYWVGQELARVSPQTA